MSVVYKSAAIEAARIAGRSPAMDEAVDRVAAKARALAQAHRVSGNYASNIGTEPTRGKNGVTDRIAYADDPAAVSIEWGHLTRRGVNMEGPQKFVDGLHIMGRAAQL